MKHVTKEYTTYRATMKKCYKFWRAHVININLEKCTLLAGFMFCVQFFFEICQNSMCTSLFCCCRTILLFEFYLFILKWTLVMSWTYLDRRRNRADCYVSLITTNISKLSLIISCYLYFYNYQHVSLIISFRIASAYAHLKWEIRTTSRT